MEYYELIKGNETLIGRQTYEVGTLKIEGEIRVGKQYEITDKGKRFLAIDRAIDQFIGDGIYTKHWGC